MRTNPPQMEPKLTSGDLAAGEDRWSDAIDSWEHAVRTKPELEPAVGARLNWYLAHKHGSSHESGPLRNSVHLMLWSLAAALIAGALVLIPDTPGSVLSNLFAVGAWIMIVLSAVMAVIASHRIGSGHADAPGDLLARFQIARAWAERHDQQTMRSESENER